MGLYKERKASRKGLSSAVVKDCTMAAAALFGTTGQLYGDFTTDSPDRVARC